MKNKSYRLFILLLFILSGWVFRNNLLYFFQTQRLKNMPHKEKLWAHRVNSIPRLEKVAGDFAGVEADLVFDDSINAFRVYHPPSEEKNLLLVEWLKVFKPKNKKTWFDVKVLNTADTLKALVHLDELTKIYKLKDNVFFELYDMDAANFFAAKGYTVSMNISKQVLDDKTKIDPLKKNMLPTIRYVSQEDIYTEQLKKHFPDKQILTWAIAFNHTINREYLRQLLNDPQIAVVLINIKSNHYY
jgi:hypothetical protein